MPLSSPRLALVALAFAVVALVGCAGASPDEVALTRWELLGPTRASIELPAHIDAYLAAHPAAYTLSTTANVPAALANRELTLAFPFLPALATLRANGVVATPLEDVISDRYRSRGPEAWRIPASVTGSGALTLELTLANTWTQSAWLESVPRLGASPHGDRWYVFVRSWNDATAAGAIGTLVTTGFTYLAMYVLGRRRRPAHGWFALQGFTAAYFPFFQLGVSQLLFGRFDVPILAVSLAAAPIGSVYFTHANFGLTPPSRFWAWLMGAVVLSSVVWSGPFETTPHVGPFTVAAVLLAVAHQLYILTRLCLQRPRPLGTLGFLLSWVGLAATTWDECGQWIGLGVRLGGLRMASAGLTLFGILQALALSREHLGSLLRSDALNAELQGRVKELEEHEAEIAALNDELRRQIAERSGQLADALARLGGNAAPEALHLAPGDIVKERYEVLREIGAGAMGKVYEVVRLGDGKRFALKVLTGISGALDMARFAREAQLTSQVDHPNVVSIVDIDVASSGLIFIVMELVTGSSRLGFQARYGEHSFALDVLGQLASGLAAVHEAGIVHRDLKPANVLVNEEAGELSVKITDFGVSSIAGAEASETDAAPSTRVERAPRASIESIKPSAPRALPHSTPISNSSLTETGVLLGTPIYMAPELAFGAKNAQPSCDVFSLGVIAHELLTRRRPWDESPAFARQRGRSVPPAPPLASLCPWLDPALADALDACLSPDPALRPTSRDLAVTLRRKSPAA